MAEACSSKSRRMSECWMDGTGSLLLRGLPPPTSTDGHLLLLLLPPSNQITAREGKKGLSKVDGRWNIRPAQRRFVSTKSQNPSQLFLAYCFVPLSLCPWKRMHACDGSRNSCVDMRTCRKNRTRACGNQGRVLRKQSGAAAMMSLNKRCCPEERESGQGHLSPSLDSQRPSYNSFPDR